MGAFTNSGNIGSAYLGSGNTGSANLGSGNAGVFNLGSGNAGVFNVSLFTQETAAFASGNGGFDTTWSFGQHNTAQTAVALFAATGQPH
jgi:Pentapeptide repeats (8 copies)